ncbi:MAG: hypothetical protein R2849_16030 [Thermomicrobiales bacterium]
MNLTQVAILNGDYGRAEDLVSESLERSRQARQQARHRRRALVPGRDREASGRIRAGGGAVSREPGAVPGAVRSMASPVRWGLGRRRPVICQLARSKATLLLERRGVARERTRSPLLPRFGADHESMVSTLRNVLGKPAFDSRWSTGYAR